MLDGDSGLPGMGIGGYNLVARALVTNSWSSITGHQLRGISRVTLALTDCGPATGTVTFHFLEPVAFGTSTLDVGASSVTLPSVLVSSLVSRRESSSSSSSYDEKWKLLSFSVKIAGRLRNHVHNMLPVNNKI